MSLQDHACACTKKNVELLSLEGIEALLKEVHGWEVIENHHIRKAYKFPSYMDGVAFVNQCAAIAEEQNHHPEMYLGWRKVTVEIYTHVVDGLTDNDFILAAKYEAVKR